MARVIAPPPMADLTLAPQQLIAAGNYLPVRQLLMAAQPGAVLASTQEQFSSLCQQRDLRSSGTCAG
eukprot:3625664-Amphidinium_carterae.1